MTIQTSSSTKHRENLRQALQELFPCPEGFIDPIRGILNQVPDNKLDELTVELIAAIQTDARTQEQSSSRRRL